MPISKDNFPDKILILALVLLLALRLALASQIQPIEDEAYYRLWGLYPAYGYYDHAPMVGWWIAIGQSLFGDTLIGLRALSPLSAFLGSFFIWRIAFVSFDRSVANVAVILFHAIPMIGFGSILMTPDVPSVFFWGLALWTLVEWNRSGHNMWWLAFGIAAGLGLLSKYSNVFLGVGVILWLALSPRWRDAIRAPQFYIAGCLALLLFSPVIYWNAMHDWVSFAKQLGRLQSSELTLRFLGEWIAGQALLLSPLIFAFLILALIQLRRSVLFQHPQVMLLVLSILPMLAYFLYYSFTSRINANWTVPLYSNVAILAAYSVSNMMKQKDHMRRRLAYSVPLVGFAMSAIVLVDAITPIVPAHKRNPLSQLRGYDDLAKQVESIAKNKMIKTIVTSRYQLTGLLSYHLPDLSIVQMTERARYANMPDPLNETFRGSVLYIGAASEVEKIITALRSCFESAKKLADLNRMDRGEIIAAYQLWQIDNLNDRLFVKGRADDCAP